MNTRAQRRVAAVILTMGTLLGLALGVCASPLLQVRRVMVCGPDPSLASEVAGQIRVPAGASVLLYPLHRVTRDARRCHRVGEVNVRRASPSVLEVEVKAREPLAALDDGEGYTLVSREGILLCRATEAPVALPRLRGLTTPRAPLGTQLDRDRWRWTLEILAGATKAGIRDGLSLDLSNLYQVRLTTADGVTANLGNVNSLTRKTVILGRVLAELRADGEQPVSVDVSTPESPLWRTQ
ncbi:MAG: hypothetical protein HPY69_14225 [Armatimonadetes bacterium]|nr:hypothetical protein [Armatimonadota bacterium]